MRTAAKVDDNQPLIVDCLRRCGCLVLVLSQLGNGVPDLLVGTPRGILILIEIKDGKKPPSAQKLTPDQALWHAAWRRYPLFCVSTVAEAVEAIGHECTVFDIDRIGKRTCASCSREMAA